MSLSGWLDTNRNRAYPFVAGTTGVEATSGLENLPDGVIVDAGFIAGPGSGFVSGTDRVFLSEIARSGSTITFTFSGDALGFGGTPLVFTRSLSDPRFTTSFTNSLPSAYPPDFSEFSMPSDSADHLDDCAPAAWSGFLTTGDLSLLSTWLSDDTSYTSNGAYALIEPGAVHNQANGWLEAVAVANLDRTRATAPTGCDAITWPFPLQNVYVWAQCIQGDIRFLPGANTDVAQTDGNAITFSVRPGGGTGAVCTPVPVFHDEVVILGHNPQIPSINGGSPCNGVLRSVNGLGGPNLSIIAGPGVSVVPDPDHNRVLVNVGTNNLSSCLNAYSRISDSIA